ncbi:MAG: hypothetical protein H0Z33_11200 [Bacillaceae bacterium]|nr:hypothetical protein [Bacillaceae bacterium]
MFRKIVLRGKRRLVQKVVKRVSQLMQSEQGMIWGSIIMGLLVIGYILFTNRDTIGQGITDMFDYIWTQARTIFN